MQNPELGTDLVRLVSARRTTSTGNLLAGRPPLLAERLATGPPLLLPLWCRGTLEVWVVRIPPRGCVETGEGNVPMLLWGACISVCSSLSPEHV